MKRILLLGFTLLVFGLVFCTGPQLEDILLEEIPQLMEAAEVPGLSIAIVRDDEIYWAENFGVHIHEIGEPLD